MCKTIKNAEAEFQERITIIDSHWTRTSIQLDFLKRVWHALNDELKATQEQILYELGSKLAIASSKIEGLLISRNSQIPIATNRPHEQYSVKRFKYALLKDSLDNAIQDLDKWQKLFDPSWFLILMMSSSHIDTELMTPSGATVPPVISSVQSLRKALQGITDPSEKITKPRLEDAIIRDIAFATAKIAQRSGSSRLYVLDPAPCIVSGNADQLTNNVRNLARRFLYSEPFNFGLLEGYGVTREQDPRNPSNITFTFVFKIPKDAPEPESLRSVMLRADVNHSLSDRLEIANNLAKAVSFVHTFGFVHKNICPENVLVFANNAASLGQAYLVGFGAFRNAEGHTWRRGDNAWEKNIYRHPHRQGLVPDEHFLMQHDIYSLGVCLLEIGLWTTFVCYNGSGKGEPSPALSEGLVVSGATSNKDCFVFLARAVLPRRMGSRYARVVETCLTCLDIDNVDFGDESEFRDTDGVLVAVRYIEKVSHLKIVCAVRNFTELHRYFSSCPALPYNMRT